LIFSTFKYEIVKGLKKLLKELKKVQKERVRRAALAQNRNG